MVLSFRLATARSSKLSALKSPATSATGFLPTVEFCSGKNRGARPPRQRPAGPQASGEQGERNRKAITDEKAGWLSVLRAQQHLTPALNQRERSGEIGRTARQSEQI